MSSMIRITRPMPFAVRGTCTVWVVYLNYYGKYGSHCQLLARCVEPERFVTLYEGKTRDVGHRHLDGFYVRSGIEAKICRAMVEQGCAKVIQSPHEFPGELFLKH